MKPEDLRHELEQLVQRLESGVMNGHIREVANWLAMHTSSIAFDERFETLPIEGGAEYRQRPPRTTFEQLRAADIQDASKVLGAAARGEILPNAATRIRAVLQYLPPAAIATAPLPSPIPPDWVRRQVYQYRVLSLELGSATTLVDFLHRMGDVRPVARQLAGACAARGVDPAPFERLVSADGEALGRAHLSPRGDTQSDLAFSAADAQIPLLLQAVADEERSAPVGDGAVARLVDEVMHEALPGLNPAALADVHPSARKLRAGRLIELAQHLARAARQRGVGIDAFERLLLSVTGSSNEEAANTPDKGDVTKAFETLTRLRCTPLPEQPRGATSAATSSTAIEEAPRQTPPTGKPVTSQTPRSMTQDDVDREIAAYRAARATRYNELRDGVRAKRPGAIKAARKLFGRNHLARQIGCKSSAMVSKSTIYQTIQAELHLNDHQRRRARTGLEVAANRAAQDEGDSTLDAVLANETRALLRKHLRPDEAQAAIDKLDAGQMTDEQARELVDVCREQRDDARSRR
jgi:hypothetical protein